MYYHICPHCGCNLDPGERCDCAKAKKEQPLHRPRREQPISYQKPNNIAAGGNGYGRSA